MKIDTKQISDYVYSQYITHRVRFLILVLLLAALSGCAHQRVKPLLFVKGEYREYPFEYPSTLSSSEVDFIVMELKKITDRKIGIISLARDYRYDVYACSNIIRNENIEPVCDSADWYRFGYGEKDFTNFTIAPTRHHSFPLFEFRFKKNDPAVQGAYTEGRYQNVPLWYSSEIPKDSVRDIVEAVEEVSNDEIIVMDFTEDGNIKIKTCRSGSRLPHHCGRGGTIIYDHKNHVVVENRCCWIQ